ncbi:diguanylate cyclase [Neobacillus sp. YIM B02564]|uniref:Diguanylate cyclase n=1 Tax=Neobacillus paridis TaxID=2803862 RepID=A0ABS1TT53_9BACI|nr:diguanylate cyclase [Neobacillus paridis]MBL4954501.1 diguanylate cyclase [Neobacillus paridis]
MISIGSIRYSLNVNIQGQRALDSIETSSNHLFKALIDQETGQRGYNLTKDADFLEPYWQGAKEFSESSEALLQKTKEFPDLHAEAQKIVEKGQYWHDHYGAALVVQTQKGNQPSVQILNEGKKAIDDFRRSTKNFSDKIEGQRSIVRNLMKTRINFTLAALMISIFVIIVIDLLINIKLLKSLIKPIIELSNCVKSYTEHDFSKGIPSYRKNDEMFELIKNVDFMRMELSNSITSLKSQVNIDELTGLYNRRHFNEFIEKEWELAKENSENFSLILFDIDYYKNYNDTYGHLAGDDCLKIISERLQDLNHAPPNCIARYGGEEFGIILLQRTEQEVLALAEEIRNAILDLKIPHQGSPIADYVTISLGAASIKPTGDMKPNEIISMADKALYASKQKGRNQVTYYTKQFSY